MRKANFFDKFFSTLLSNNYLWFKELQELAKVFPHLSKDVYSSFSNETYKERYYRLYAQIRAEQMIRYKESFENQQTESNAFFLETSLIKRQALLTSLLTVAGQH